MYHKSIGISFKKVEYIKNVYHYFFKNNLNYKDFTDSEVTKELTKIKGVGKWTSEMFLIFILFRKNIFSNGDLALINSIKVNYNINNLSNKKLDDLEIKIRTKQQLPYYFGNQLKKKYFFKKTTRLFFSIPYKTQLYICQEIKINR